MIKINYRSDYMRNFVSYKNNVIEYPQDKIYKDLILMHNN